jgi:hypothetical protein
MMAFVIPNQKCWQSINAVVSAVMNKQIPRVDS